MAASTQPLLAFNARCAAPQEIIDHFEPEFARLSLMTLMLPWGDEEIRLPA